ncbi:MAG: methyltransferase domain-containing protein [Microbacteriaceae bacterium]|nr:methyltransferase domain-containing protein [Microbacteriaceae bacterium]
MKTDQYDFQTFYDSRWLPVDPYFKVHRSRFLQTWDFVAKQGLPSTGRALDLGGIGPLGAFVASLGWEVDETKTDLRGALPVQTWRYDLVICTETIEHIKDQDSPKIEDLESFHFTGMSNLFGEMARVVAPNGFIVLTTPNANSFITLHKWLNGEALLMDPTHVRELCVNDIRRLAANASLKIRQLDVVNSWPEFGGSVTALRNALQRFLDGNKVERGDNIFVALGKP